jgi:glutamate synthase domain-containing protein 3
VLDRRQRMISEGRYHTEFLEAMPFEGVAAEQQDALKALIEEHVRLTYSVVGKTLLADWDLAAQDLVLFTPKPQA